MTGADPRSGDGPLFAWGAQLRAARFRRRRRLRAIAFAALPALVAVASVIAPPRPRLLWNASASVPVGLYRVSPGAPAGVGEFVVARAPAGIRMLAAQRRYLPANVPLVKRVAAVPGDEVCALGPGIFINGAPAAERRSADGHGRALPWWQGCVRLREGERFLLVGSNPASFDGRYFGVSAPADLLGRARLLWAKPGGPRQ